MTAAIRKDWKEEFGIERRKPPSFFAGPGDLDTAGLATPQIHVLRRAFDDLKIDGALCLESNPLIYFRLMDGIDATSVTALHRTFWNQGIAPVLVLVAPDEVHVYSGLSSPHVKQGKEPPGFVETLRRVTEELQAFILAVETGEYFHRHRSSFDPRQRVDRKLLRHLEATRELLDKVPAAKLDSLTPDALLCRVVFTCYLFDRAVIDRKYLEEAGIDDAKDLKDVLGRAQRSEAKADLYRLFSQLGQDFNGDLFSDDVDAEAKQIKPEHLDIINDFIRGTDPVTHQQSFWPYEFAIIPIETISAIYEHFLKAAGEQEKKETGAFYTPRFLAELVLDQTLASVPQLLDKRFLDPACGSGIFLVGLFARLAEEWNRKNPKANYDAKLKGLTAILKTNLFGIDKNRSACLIAAFSLYLALLDQLSPPDIRRVLKKIKVLPRLVAGDAGDGATIRCADFFTEAASLPEPVDFVIGNPPWSEAKDRSTPISVWCDSHKPPIPGRQTAFAFVLKAPEHLKPHGKVCFVLPHMLIFGHTKSAIRFQQHLFRTHAVELILNLADFQRFLFEESEAPALVVRYAKEWPVDSGHRIDYWSPKTDWAVTQAEVISILPQDRARLTVREVLDDLRGDDAPLIWKERYWATFRDRRLLDRLRLYPRLRDIIGQRAKRESKRWISAEGFEPFGVNDKPETLRRLSLPNTARIEGATHDLDLILLEQDCEIQETLDLELRRAISNTDIFKKPLVLVKRGYSSTPQVAFANFNVAYRHGIRGIHGPSEDSALLALLTYYLRSKLARYFLFHTSTNWGVSRARVDLDDLMRLPFPLPEQNDNPKRAVAIAAEAAQLMIQAASQATEAILGRDDIVQRMQDRAEVLVQEYFDVNDIERILIDDTDRIIVPSVRPTRMRAEVPTIIPAQRPDYAEYIEHLCGTLNGWANREYEVHGKVISDGDIGVGMVVLEKTRRGEEPHHLQSATQDVLVHLHNLQKGAAKGRGTVELARGLRVFDKSLLYVTKPNGRRFWTRTAALNDADEIAGTLLTRPHKEDA